jgi:hypothetical protein
VNTLGPDDSWTAAKQGGQLLDPTPELIDVVLHGQDAADALEVAALVLRESLDQPKPCNVAGRVAPAALCTAAAPPRKQKLPAGDDS